MSSMSGFFRGRRIKTDFQNIERRIFETDDLSRAQILINATIHRLDMISAGYPLEMFWFPSQFQKDELSHAYVSIENMRNTYHENLLHYVRQREMLFGASDEPPPKELTFLINGLEVWMSTFLAFIDQKYYSRAKLLWEKLISSHCSIDTAVSLYFAQEKLAKDFHLDVMPLSVEKEEFATQCRFIPKDFLS